MEILSYMCILIFLEKEDYRFTCVSSSYKACYVIHPAPACILGFPGEFLKNTCLDPTPRDSEITPLGHW